MRWLSLLLVLLSTPLAAQSELEIVHRFDSERPPGNIAIGPDGRLFMTLHEFYGKDLRVVEVLPDGSTRPYPDERWSQRPVGDGPGLYGVLGLNADRNGVLWLLDSGGADRAGRLVGWDTRAEKLHRIIYLGKPIIGDAPFLNDLAIDLDNQAIYVSDTASPETAALIVVDLDTGRARRVLEGSPFTVPEDVEMIIDGKSVTLGGAPARIGVNPITVDAENEWVYFAPMSCISMYRVRTRDLLDESLDESSLRERVERYGDKPLSDGSTVDSAGNVYITAIDANAIGVTRPDG
ncbi:MAG: L-dopachrome tautomerase-related protein, partial [Pseudomonadota bacterium]